MVQETPSFPAAPGKLAGAAWPFAALAGSCPLIAGGNLGSFVADGREYALPRFTFHGPRRSTDPLRVGVFALIHGDEPAGCLGLQRLLETLVATPALAEGYELLLYPLCNPTGFEDGTRFNRAGFDLNREFWRGSPLPEIQLLEAELRTQRIDGIIALHADDTSDGVYGYAHGRTLNEQLLAPALRASTGALPLDTRSRIDGFAASEGIIADCFEGILAPPPGQRPRPFEIILETPARAPLPLQADAVCSALVSVLAEYRGFIAHGQYL